MPSLLGLDNREKQLLGLGFGIRYDVITWTLCTQFKIIYIPPLKHKGCSEYFTQAGVT